MTWLQEIRVLWENSYTIRNQLGTNQANKDCIKWYPLINKQYRRLRRQLHDTKIAKEFRKFLRKTCFSLPVFMPDHSYKIAWDCILFVIGASLIFLIPLEVCVYGGILFVFPNNLLFGILLFLLILDLIASANTAVFIKGQLISDRSRIIAH